MDRISGYEEMKEVLAGRASEFLEEHLGESYWTKKVAPLVLDSLYSAVAASTSGGLTLEHPSFLLDETANRLVLKGKEQLAALSEENLPDLPVVGNLVEDLAKSQHLRLRNGSVDYRMRMRKRLAPEFKLGSFSMSGGTEAFINGKTISRKSVASIGYQGEESSYRVQLYGRNLRFDIRRSCLDLRLDWNPQVIKFNLNLDLGSWL